MNRLVMWNWLISLEVRRRSLGGSPRRRRDLSSFVYNIIDTWDSDSINGSAVETQWLRDPLMALTPDRLAQAKRTFTAIGHRTNWHVDSGGRISELSLADLLGPDVIQDWRREVLDKIPPGRGPT